MLIPKPSTVILELHPLHPVCGFCNSHDLTEKPTNLAGLRLPARLCNLLTLILHRLLLSAHSILLHNPRLPPPRLIPRTNPRSLGALHQGKIQPGHAKVAEGRPGGEVADKGGVWGDDGNVGLAVSGVGGDLSGAQLLGEGLRGFGG